MPTPPPSPALPDAAAVAPVLQPLDYTALRAVLRELDGAVVPSRFEKAQQSDPQTLQLALRTLKGSQWLELSWLAEAPRLLAIPPPPRIGEGSTLAQQLQHGLRGLALVDVHQPAWERVVELRFAARPGEPVERSLVLELMGRHSNLFLLDAERRVIALARQVRDCQSRLRPIGTGDPYQPPPVQAGEPPRAEESCEVWRQRLSLLPLPLGKALLGAYQGTSPALVRQLLADPDPAAPLQASQPVLALQESQWQWLWRRWQGWLAALDQQRFALVWCGGGAYRCWSPPGCAEALGVISADRSGPQEAAGSSMGAGDLAINRALAAHYAGILDGRQWRQRCHGLDSRLRAAIERERRQLAQQQDLLADVPAAGGLQRQADALLCQADPDRDTIAEAQSLYRRARRLRRSAAAITPRIALHEQRLSGLETSLTFLEQLAIDGCDRPWQQGEDPLAALEQELQEQLERLRPQASSGRGGARSRAQRRQGAQAEPQPLELRSAGGLRLQVGRNHRQNEWISLRQARRGDLWFHAQEQPGSHVVLKASERTAQPQDLQQAADLAAHFSRGRGNRRVPVLMVAAETLQRIPGAEPGTVRHRGGEVLWGEPERAQALLHQEGPPPDEPEPSIVGQTASVGP